MESDLQLISKILNDSSLAAAIRQSFRQDITEVLTCAGILDNNCTIDINDIASVQNTIQILILLQDQEITWLYNSYVTAKWLVCLELCGELLLKLCARRRELVVGGIKN